ncbi:hypothetical protein PT7_0233 [Pusillimonas sp. T7-7]|nr:hypothetical protein PT7_0233 [Pusillimonas sp. T7-7]
MPNDWSKTSTLVKFAILVFSIGYSLLPTARTHLTCRCIIQSFTVMTSTKFSSREELLDHIRQAPISGLDSEFSPMMVALAKAFEAKGMHLNRWWVMTPSDWECPSCKRGKSKIVRLNRHGYLMGHLHEHHDHMQDLVRERFGALSTARKTVVADKLAEKFAVRAGYGLAAYDNTVICSDCNRADGDAKKLAGTHPNFSYSPDEIGCFVIAKDNFGPHEIDKQEAERIWEEGKELFKVRLDMVDQIASLAADNAHWYQPSTRTAQQIERTAKIFLRLHGLYDIAVKEGVEAEKLLYTANVFSGEHSSWRRKATTFKGKNVPTPGDLDHLIAVRGNFWKKVEESWICPCCGRTKLHCVRPSNKNTWVFEVKGKWLFSEDALDARNTILLCDDCSNVANHLGREAGAEAGERLEYPSSLIRMQELRDTVIVKSHCPHRVDNAKVDKLMPILIDRLKSMQDAD